MKKKIDLLEIALIAFMGIMIIFTGMAAGYDKKIFMIQLVITLAAVAFGIWRLFAARRDFRKLLEYIGGRLGAVKSDALIKFPLPVAVTNGEGEILWTNGLFHNDVMKGEECYGKNVKELFADFDLEKVFAPGGFEVKFREGSYSVCATTSSEMGEKLFAFYFIDKTKERKIEKLYAESRPAVLSITLDNLEELFANCKESEKAGSRERLKNFSRILLRKTTLS